MRRLPLISVVTPCYNEEENVSELYARVKAVFATLPQYRYEHIFIDNASTDGTVAVLKALAGDDDHVKIIVNARNFGHIRSPYYAMMQAQGDAVISIVSDLQDPPELITEFLQQWEAGYKVVLGIKTASEESKIMYALRGLYYRTLRKLSDVELIEHYTGFGLYDQRVIAILRTVDDAYPYFRGLIAEIGFPSAKITYTQPQRKHGKTKNNFFTLFDIAMLGMTSYSRVPMRLATFVGLGCALLSLLIALVYFVLKLLMWSQIQIGIAPLVIGIFFFSSVQLTFLGLLGEYIGAIHTQALKRPLVVELERINFAAEMEEKELVTK